jgi:mRNA interferase MazF
VVVQSSELAALSTVIVAPTSSRALETSFRPPVKVRGRSTRVLVEHARAVNRDRVGRSAGHLAADEITAVDDAVRLVFGVI